MKPFYRRQSLLRYAGTGILEIKGMTCNTVSWSYNLCGVRGNQHKSQGRCSLGAYYPADVNG